MRHSRSWAASSGIGDIAGIKAKTQYPVAPSNWNSSDPWPPDKVFALVQAGLLSGKSIGFLPTKLHFATDKEAEKNGWPQGIPVFDEWLLLEYSCVFLPANQNSLVQEVSKGMQIDPWWMEAFKEILDGNLYNLVNLKKNEPIQAQPSFTSEEQIQRAIDAHLRSIDWEAIITRATTEALDLLRGRV